MKNDGGPAFPGKQAAVVIPVDLRDDPRIHTVENETNGMSLRDYFAGQVVIGVVYDNTYSPEDLAKGAYEIADAMLKERGKE